MREGTLAGTPSDGRDMTVRAGRGKVGARKSGGEERGETGSGTHVEDDDRVCGLEIDTEAAGARREQERKVGRALPVEVRDALLARVGRDGAVELQVLHPGATGVVTLAENLDV